MSATGPFYTTVTRIKDLKSDSKINLVTLPAGTVLFRGIRLPTENPLSFYSDFLGVPSLMGGSPTMCLKPTHNVFFYAHPLVCFGAHNVGAQFDAVQVVVLVKDVTVICMIRPSPMVRGEGKRYSGDAPIQRCSNFKESCGDLTEDAVKQLAYDNCLSPDYQRRSGTRGWMAIANLDSIEPKLEDEQVDLTPSMAPYLKGLERRQPGVGSLLAASTYVDATKTEKGKLPRAGFPEIVLYPYATAPEDTSLHQLCSSHMQAMSLIAKHAKRDNLLYLPLATITEKGAVDMISGHFSFDRVRGGGNPLPAVGSQTAVEANLTRYLNNVMRYGLRLPFYGGGAMSFDMRTGFYIMPQVTAPAYKPNILPIDSNQAPAKRKDIQASLRKYLLKARGLNETYGKQISLPTGAVPNAFIFSRPILLMPIFKAIGIGLPKDFYQYIKELRDEYEAGKAQPLTIRAPVAAVAAQQPVAQARTPEFGPTTPAYGAVSPKSPAFRVNGSGDQSPAYAPGTPAYGPATPVAEATPESPPFRVNNTPNTKVQELLNRGVTKAEVMGGYGQPYNPYGLTQEQQAAFMAAAKGGTRSRVKVNSKGRKTMRKTKDPLKQYAKHFSTLWKVFAKGKM